MLLTAHSCDKSCRSDYLNRQTVSHDNRHTADDSFCRAWSGAPNCFLDDDKASMAAARDRNCRDETLNNQRFREPAFASCYFGSSASGLTAQKSRSRPTSWRYQLLMCIASRLLHSTHRLDMRQRHSRFAKADMAL